MAHCKPLFWAGLFILVAAPAKGDGTITAGTASFTWHNLATSATEGNADFRAASASPDHVHQLWWWYRVDSGAMPDAHEFPFPAPDTESYDPARSVLSWNALGPPGSQFRAELTTLIHQNSSNSAYVSQGIAITNLESSPLAMQVIVYLDPDVGGSPGADVVTQFEALEYVYNRATDGVDSIDSAAGPYHVAIPISEGHTGNNTILAAHNDGVVNLTLPGLSLPFSGDVAWGVNLPITISPQIPSISLAFEVALNRPIGSFCFTPTCLGDFNGDNRVNGSDVAGFVRCAATGAASPGCECADMNWDNAIDSGDLSVFVPKLLGVGDPNPNCP